MGPPKKMRKREREGEDVKHRALREGVRGRWSVWTDTHRLGCVRMVRFIKPGKVVVLLQGKHAGKKAVVVKNFDDGTGTRAYGHALVAGVSKAPKSVTRGMGKKLLEKRSRVKPFIKVVNYVHVMPTRYVFDAELKETVPVECATNTTTREESSRALKKIFQERFQEGKNRWFFSRLRF